MIKNPLLFLFYLQQLHEQLQGTEQSQLQLHSKQLQHELDIFKTSFFLFYI